MKRPAVILNVEEAVMETATVELLVELERRLIDRAFLYDDPQAYREGVAQAMREVRVELSERRSA
jgi:hypothetical protein